MSACPCRTRKGVEATHAIENVAPGRAAMRHARPSMSLQTSEWGDRVIDACRTSQAPEATHSRTDVAHLADPERHALACVSLRTRVKCDIDPCASPPWRSSRATFSALLLAPPALAGARASHEGARGRRHRRGHRWHRRSDARAPRGHRGSGSPSTRPSSTRANSAREIFSSRSTPEMVPSANARSTSSSTAPPAGVARRSDVSRSRHGAEGAGVYWIASRRRVRRRRRREF